MVETQKTIKINAKETDYTFSVFTCNICGTELAGENGWKILDRLENHICSICGKGHWCREHLVSLSVGERRQCSEYEEVFMRICPECQIEYKDIIKRIIVLEGELNMIDERLGNWRDTLWKLRHAP